MWADADKVLLRSVLSNFQRPFKFAGTLLPMTEPSKSPEPLLVADAHLQREGGSSRVTVDVAVGILINAQQQFLLTSRPPGKVYEGYWEFPGGKLEAGESVSQAYANTFDQFAVSHAEEYAACKEEHQHYPIQCQPKDIDPLLVLPPIDITYEPCKCKSNDMNHLIDNRAERIASNGTEIIDIGPTGQYDHQKGNYKQRSTLHEQLLVWFWCIPSKGRKQVDKLRQ
jgi:hypothetical protein